jgi:HSP20 family molecular chaperone IbpA
MKRRNLIRKLNDEFNPLRRSILEDLFFPLESTLFPEISSNLTLNINSEFKEDDSNYYIKAELPGIEKENININVDKNRVLIYAEKKEEAEEKSDFKYESSEIYYGSFSRSYSLITPIDSENVKASLKNGILYLTIPKLISSEKSSKISIE